MKTSIIKRVPNCFYFQIAEDYKAICLYEVAEKIKCNDCAATLLSLYENIVNSRMNARVKNAETFPASSSYIQKCLLGHYSEKTIYNANEFLINEGFVKIDRQKTDKENNLPNLITLNIDHVNYMLNEYGKIKVGKNYGTPTVILRNPYRNFTEGGTVNLRTELSIKNKVLEINKETLTNPQKNILNFNILNKGEEEKEEEKGGRLPNTTNELNYTAFSDVVRGAIKIDSIDKRNTYITNLGIKPSNPEASNILEAIVKNYIAIRFKNVTEFPYLNTDERAQDWAVKRCTFADFNAYTLSQISIGQAQSILNGANRKPVTQKEQTTDDKNKRLLELLKKMQNYETD